MADYQGIAAASRSIERYLGHCFGERQPVPTANTTVVLVRTDDFAPSAAAQAIGSPALSIFLYKINFNKTMRPGWSSVAGRTQRAHLPLDLHFLLTPWADNAYHEHRILGRAMQCLEQTPVLTGPLLDASGGWSTGEALQVCLEDLSTEDVMRTFDSLPTDYKLSVSYVTRVVRIDGPREERHPEVTAAVRGMMPSGEDPR